MFQNTVFREHLRVTTSNKCHFCIPQILSDVLEPTVSTCILEKSCNLGNILVLLNIFHWRGYFLFLGWISLTLIYFFIWKTVLQAFFSRLSLTLKLNFKLNIYEKALIFVTTVETSFPKCFRINNVRKKVNGFPFVFFCFFFQRPEYWKLKISIPLYDFWLTFPKTTCQN